MDQGIRLSLGLETLWIDPDQADQVSAVPRCWSLLVPSEFACLNQLWIVRRQSVQPTPI